MKSPTTKLWLKLVVTLVLMGFALFLAAGTFNYWQAWVFLGVGAVANALLNFSLTKSPVLLESRSKWGPAAEKRPIQKIILLCAMIPAFATFMIPALDRRFGWSSVPWWLSIAGFILILAGLRMVFVVFKANSFASATIEIVNNQK